MENINAGNPPRDRLQPGTLRECVKKCTKQALVTGVLHSISTDYELWKQDGVEFVVRILTNLQRKDAAKSAQIAKTRSTGQEFNPFLPYDPDLWVRDISDSHVCILNKFNVVDEHLLIITRNFVDQECLLDIDDFAAIATCLEEIDGLAFYNGGQPAGASQKHKHLQLVPFPLVANGINFPLETVYQQSDNKLPFIHAFADIKSIWQKYPLQQDWLEQDRLDRARTIFSLYRQLLEQVKITASPENRQSAAYNLLLTRENMIVIPRSREEYHGISVNSLGFAGALLVRNQEQMQLLKSTGALNLLAEVGRRK